MADVFVSFARSDMNLAKVVVEAIEKSGFTVWWDVGLKAGEAFDDVIGKELHRAAAVVVLWTRKATESAWVRSEASQGHQRAVLVPILLEDRS